MNERETAALQVEDLTYNADGLIPCIVQDEQTREVLMMAWMNEEAVRRTISQGTTWFWSRSRQKFWHKGEESGNTQKLVELRYDCDADTLLALVNPAGPACHTGETTCFYRSFWHGQYAESNRYGGIALLARPYRSGSVGCGLG